MQIFDVKPELIHNPKVCASCKKTIDARFQFVKIDSIHEMLKPCTKMYYGHSNFRNPNGDCSSYICVDCVDKMQGYVLDCFCVEEL